MLRYVASLCHCMWCNVLSLKFLYATTQWFLTFPIIDRVIHQKITGLIFGNFCTTGDGLINFARSMNSCKRWVKIKPKFLSKPKDQAIQKTPPPIGEVAWELWLQDLVIQMLVCRISWSKKQKLILTGISSTCLWIISLSKVCCLVFKCMVSSFRKKNDSEEFYTWALNCFSKVILWCKLFR